MYHVKFIQIFIVILCLWDLIFRKNPARITSPAVISSNHICSHRLSKASGPADTNAPLLRTDCPIQFLKQPCFINIDLRIYSILKCLTAWIHIHAHWYHHLYLRSQNLFISDYIKTISIPQSISLKESFHIFIKIQYKIRLFPHNTSCIEKTLSKKEVRHYDFNRKRNYCN